MWKWIGYLLLTMTTTTKIETNAEKNTITLENSDGIRVELSPEIDERVVECIDGKIFATDEDAAEELAAYIRLWTFPEARALGCAVVFW